MKYQNIILALALIAVGCVQQSDRRGDSSGKATRSLALGDAADQKDQQLGYVEEKKSDQADMDLGHSDKKHVDEKNEIDFTQEVEPATAEPVDAATAEALADAAAAVDADAAAAAAAVAAGIAETQATVAAAAAAAAASLAGASNPFSSGSTHQAPNLTPQAGTVCDDSGFRPPNGGTFPRLTGIEFYSAFRSSLQTPADDSSPMSYDSHNGTMYSQYTNLSQSFQTNGRPTNSNKSFDVATNRIPLDQGCLSNGKTLVGGLAPGLMQWSKTIINTATSGGVSNPFLIPFTANASTTNFTIQSDTATVLIPTSMSVFGVGANIGVLFAPNILMLTGSNTGTDQLSARTLMFGYINIQESGVYRFSLSAEALGTIILGNGFGFQTWTSTSGFGQPSANSETLLNRSYPGTEYHPSTGSGNVYLTPGRYPIYLENLSRMNAGRASLSLNLDYLGESGTDASQSVSRDHLERMLFYVQPNLPQ